MIGYREKLARVLDAMGGLYLVDDLLTAIGEGRMQSFAVNNSWAITQVEDYPRARKLMIVAMVGDLRDTNALEAQILDYARQVGASLVAAHGRVGWMKKARERGWRLKAKSFLYHRDM